MPSPQSSDSERIHLAVEVLIALVAMTPTVSAAELLTKLGWPSAKLAPVLASLERSGLIERWPDPDHAGSTRLMLTVKSLQRIGLSIAESGDRWNPDQPQPQLGPEVVRRKRRRCS